jgi:SAM-dependent methyltransferase
LAAAAEWIRSDSFIPWHDVRRVLVLGGGGGQQGPVIASLGYEVTVADLSPHQLRLDAQVSSRLGLEIECLELDMLDLSPLHGRDFDLVHQPVSACYVPDPLALYEQVWSVLRPGGWYDVEHWNSAHIQLRGFGEWGDGAYLIERPQQAGEPVPWHPASPADPAVVCWHFTHSLDQLIGGLCRTGFRVHRLVERTYGDPDADPGSDNHLAAYLPPFFRILAQRQAD